MSLASDVVYADLIDADPPPRELTSTARRYVAVQAPYAWLVLLVLFLVLPAIVTAAVMPTSTTIGWAIVSVAGAVALGWVTSTKRAKARNVIVHGVQQPARISGVSHSSSGVGSRLLVASR